MHPITTVLILPSVAEATKTALGSYERNVWNNRNETKKRDDCSVINFTPVWMNLESFLGKILEWKNIKLPIF